jgi:hypothetical protein
MVSQSRDEVRSQVCDEFSRINVALAVANLEHELDDRIHEVDGEVCIVGFATLPEQIGDRMLDALNHGSIQIAYHARRHLQVRENHRILQKNCTPVRVGNDDDPKLRLTFLSILCTALHGSQLTPRNASANSVALTYAFFETERKPSGSARTSRGLLP